MSIPVSSSSLTPQSLVPQRLGSIDAYRGLVMFLMMAEVLHFKEVADHLSGDHPVWKFLAEQQTHVEWAGCVLHDMIQPSFTFLVGVSLPFSLLKRATEGQSFARRALHALWRSIALVFLGVFLRSMGSGQTNFTFEDTLSQIGLGYFFLFLLAQARPGWWWVALAAILVGYWGWFAIYPLPGADFDYAAHGAIADWSHNFSGFAAHWNKNTNPASAFDGWFLNLLPREKPFQFNGGGYLTLSFIPTLGTMILGLIAGNWLVKPRIVLAKVGLLVAAGALSIAAAMACHQTGICPIVKRIWTPAWTLYSGGWCFIILAGFYLIIDGVGLAFWSYPLRVIGANSIAAYCMAHLFHGFISHSFRIHLGKDFFKLGWWSPGLEIYEPFAEGVAVLLVYWLILFWMYRNRVFIRL